MEKLVTLFIVCLDTFVNGYVDFDSELDTIRHVISSLKENLNI